MADREKLIRLLNEIENHPEKTCPHFNDNDCFNCKYDTVNDRCDMTARKADYLIANGVTVQNQWISVDEQLPETYIEVLVCFKADGSNVIAFVNRFGKWKNASTDNFIESEITHWMPLPAPPKI